MTRNLLIKPVVWAWRAFNKTFFRIDGEDFFTKEK